MLTTEGDYFEFPHGAVVIDSVVAGTAKEVGYIAISLDQVDSAYVKEVNKAKTCAIGGAIYLLVIIIGVVIFDDFFESLEEIFVF